MEVFRVTTKNQDAVKEKVFELVPCDTGIMLVCEGLCLMRISGGGLIRFKRLTSIAGVKGIPVDDLGRIEIE